MAGDPASKISNFLWAIDGLTGLKQEEYHRRKHDGDHRGAAEVDSFLSKIDYHVRSTVHLLHSETMNELGENGSADPMESQQSHERSETGDEGVQTKRGEQHYDCVNRLRKAQLNTASTNGAYNQARRQIDDLQAQSAAANEQLNRVDLLKCRICRICHDSFMTKKSSCGHLFCGDCIDYWATRVNTLSYPTPSEEARGDTEETRKVLLCPVCKQDTVINTAAGRV